MNPISNLVHKTKGTIPVSQGQGPPETSSTETMRAITWHGKRDMRVSEVPKPLITHPGDVIVKVTSCTICSGSDGHLYAGEMPTMTDGYVVGHEAMGIVVEKGDEVHNLQLGDRVAVCFNIACGKCEQCQKQNFNVCQTTNNSKLAEDFYGHTPSGLLGYSKLMGNHWGDQAEFVRVPWGDVNCCKIPSNLPDEKALFISDVLCTSLFAVDMGELKQGQTVCIWGLGPVGLLACRWAQIFGAGRVVGIDLVPERLALARERLGIDVVDRSKMSSDQVVERLQEMEPNGFDVCIEAVGFRFAMSTAHKIQRAVGLETDTPEIIHECLKTMKPGGIVSIVGDYAGLSNAFPTGLIMFKNATIKSGQCPCQKYFDTVLKHLQDGSMDPTFIISHRITMDEMPKAYEKLHLKKDGYIKVFVPMASGSDIMSASHGQLKAGEHIGNKENTKENISKNISSNNKSAIDKVGDKLHDAGKAVSDTANKAYENTKQGLGLEHSK